VTTVWQRIPDGAAAEECFSGSASAPDFVVVKIGGSLVSEKNRAGHLDADELGRYADLLADLWRAAPGRVALVAGGGAIGHGAVRHLAAGDPFASLDLTSATFTVKWAWTQALRARGVRCFPVQVGAICVLRDDVVIPQTAVIDELLRAGALPVLSGDCVMTHGGELRIFGSDRVPAIFLGGVRAGRHVRIAVLTDVPGVLADGPGGSRSIPYLHPDHLDAVTDLLWPAAAHDTSGAMAGKVEALGGLAGTGAECLILKGDPRAGDLRFLLDPAARWAPERPHTRICRAR
jgi:isopentenyl phosphate kinase